MSLNPDYSEAEKEIIRKVFPVQGAYGVQEKMPGRTVEAISIKACRMGITGPVSSFQRLEKKRRGQTETAKELAREVSRRAHAEIGCRVRLILMADGYSQIDTQRIDGPQLETVPGTVGFYADGCEASRILEDIMHHMQLREGVAA